MRSNSWLSVFVVCALLGALAGYFLTLIYKPTLIPPVLRIGGLTSPTTVLLLGTDVVYSRERRKLVADQTAFTGRSDTLMVARFDPLRNSLVVLQIPRDTNVYIPGYGRQKINAANAIGGPRLAADTVRELLGVPVDHYVVLNVHGIVELVDELGGITVQVPKKMRYIDWSAKLNIDLLPGPHTLTGNQAMGFVRFRHDMLGDIGRVQRQEIFLRAVQDKALDPKAWIKLPKLLSVAQEYILTDLTTPGLLQLASFARAVPKDRQSMFMLPGTFSGTGDWAVSDEDVQTAAARLMGQYVQTAAKDHIKISVENASSDPAAAQRLYRYLSNRGYRMWGCKNKSDIYSGPMKQTHIIAQTGNADEALLVKEDLQNLGQIVNASLGDIQSAITVVAGDDVSSLISETSQQDVRRRKHRGR